MSWGGSREGTGRVMAEAGGRQNLPCEDQPPKPTGRPTDPTNPSPDRVFGILREKNPELTGERRRTVLKPPQVAREGTKKTVFTNFMDLCKVGW
jgi:hypothetical protein